MTGKQILGWDWIIDACVPLTYTKMSGALSGVNGGKSGGGIGDLLLSPFLMSYHADNFDLLLSPGIYIPSGDYDKDDPTSAGLGYWGLLPTFGATIYLNEDKSASFSMITRYEISFSNSDTDTKEGNLLHLEGALGKTFESGFDLALCFAGSWQLTDHKGKGRANDKHLRKQAVGPELAYTFKEAATNVSLRWLYEFDNRNTTQGKHAYLKHHQALLEL